MLKYDLTAPSSCCPSWNLARHNIFNYGNARFDQCNNHFATEINLFSDVLRFRFKELNFFLRTRDMCTEILANAWNILNRRFSEGRSRRENTRRYRFSRLILLHPNAFRWTVFAVKRDFRKLFLPNREIKLKSGPRNVETRVLKLFRKIPPPVYPLLF